MICSVVFSNSCFQIIGETLLFKTLIRSISVLSLVIITIFTLSPVAAQTESAGCSAVNSGTFDRFRNTNINASFFAGEQIITNPVDFRDSITPVTYDIRFNDGSGLQVVAVPHTYTVPTDGTVTLSYSENGKYFTLFEFTCSPASVVPPDTRINWQYGDLNAVVYAHESGDGVAVYCYVDGVTGLGMQVNQATVDNAGATSQDVPVLEHNENGCHVAFYILDSGEYQINIWTWDGKLYEIIADNINFTDATMREVE